MFTCASCRFHGCNSDASQSDEMVKFPKNCPTVTEDANKSLELYQEESLEIAQVSAAVIAEGQGKLTRMEEIILFAKQCNYKTLGLAFCIAFPKEAETVTKILRHHGFAVESVICKYAAIPRQTVGLDATGIMCNPIGQAQLLNERKTDFNIILGLCVGHDTLFIKHSDAPIGILAVKDRVLDHNPIKAIRQADAEYKEKLFPEK